MKYSIEEKKRPHWTFGFPCKKGFGRYKSYLIKNHQKSIICSQIKLNSPSEVIPYYFWCMIQPSQNLYSIWMHIVWTKNYSLLNINKLPSVLSALWLKSESKTFMNFWLFFLKKLSYTWKMIFNFVKIPKKLNFYVAFKKKKTLVL